MARPSKLTPALRDAICAHIEVGNYPEVSAEAEGISSATFYSWMKRGEAEAKGPYLDFRESVVRARARAETGLLRESRTACDRDGNARDSLKIMEKRFGERWGQKITIDMRDQALEWVIGRVQQSKGKDSGFYREFLECISESSSEPGAAEATEPNVH